MSSNRISVVAFLGFACVLLAAAPAEAAGFHYKHWILVGVGYAEDQPFIFLIAAAVSLVVALLGLARESGAFIVLGGFFLTVFCFGVFIVFELTTTLVPHPRVAGLRDDEPSRPPPAVIQARANVPAGAPIGAECHRSADCTRGAACARIVGTRRCWLPCTQDGGCADGFACLPGKGGRFCVR